MRICVSINTMSASGIRIICSNRQLLVSRRIHNLDVGISACVNRCCLSVRLSSIQSQSLAGHFDSHRAGRRGRFACVNSAGKFIITGIRFGYSHMCYAAFIQLTTQADIFRLGNSTRFIIGLFLFRRIGIESLSCLFRPISSVREGHIAGSFDNSACTRCCQSVCNLNNARQICILVACIEQLISQLVQYFLDMILFCCRITIRKATGNPLAIGDQSDLGIGSGSLDRKITAINDQRIICIMTINNSCVTAVIIYGNTLVGILINYTGAVQLRNIAAGKRCLQRIY